jgi:hypothetical protein
MSWFRARGPCLKGGYPFEKDTLWQNRVLEIGKTLKFATPIMTELERKSQSLLGIFGGWISAESITSRLNNEVSKIWLLAALFDDSLDKPIVHKPVESDPELENNAMTHLAAFSDDAFGPEKDSNAFEKVSSDGKENSSDEIEGFVQVALLRDNLFHVGSSALQLLVTEEIFRMRPEATAGDMHLLRTCAITDDVLVYIMMKWNIHHCLFDGTAYCREEFQTVMEAADNIGTATWNRRGGWVLPGGVAAYRRRHLNLFWRKTKAENLPESGPMYPGLGGGRLCGEISKLPKSVTGDLQFSFKCIVGALVLALGTDGMWCCLRPLFEEVLVMTPDELREEYRDTSSICRTYKQGKK